MADSNKKPEVHMPEPGKRNHIRVELFGGDQFEFKDPSSDQPKIAVHALSISPDSCILWGPDADQKDFDEREHWAITTLEELPISTQALINELLSKP